MQTLSRASAFHGTPDSSWTTSLRPRSHSQRSRPWPSTLCDSCYDSRLRDSTQEVVIFRVEQRGSESCELSTNSSFVLVRVPVSVEGDGAPGEAAFHYSMGSFCGRDTLLPLREGLRDTLRFRIPLELFRARERLSVEVFASDSSDRVRVLWSKRWEAVWRGQAPGLEPIVD